MNVNNKVFVYPVQINIADVLSCALGKRRVKLSLSFQIRLGLPTRVFLHSKIFVRYSST